MKRNKLLHNKHRETSSFFHPANNFFLVWKCFPCSLIKRTSSLQHWLVRCRKNIFYKAQCLFIYLHRNTINNEKLRAINKKYHIFSTCLFRINFHCNSLIRNGNIISNITFHLYIFFTEGICEGFFFDFHKRADISKNYNFQSIRERICLALKYSVQCKLQTIFLFKVENKIKFSLLTF